MVWHFKNIYEGYITVMTAPLPRHYLEKIPIKDQVNGAGFRPDEVANMPTSGAFKYESVTRSRSCASPRTRTTRASRRASRPTSTT
jgi:hypothetical protein